MFKPIFTLTSEVCLPISSLFGSYFIGNLRLSSSISIFLAIADVWVSMSWCVTEEKSMGIVFRIRLRLRTQRVAKSLC